MASTGVFLALMILGDLGFFGVSKCDEHFVAVVAGATIICPVPWGKEKHDGRRLKGASPS